MPELWIRSYARALTVGDSLEIARVEALAADYDAHNPGSSLLDELEAIKTPAAA
ncbi:hypothetical protein [Streptomyces fradiae]|uniref:hypothetical protein n=1 Tax=Streptomyces fradiae TaxID=1906 RepID=UPI0036FBA216